MAESFSRQKSRHAPQKEGGLKIPCETFNDWGGRGCNRFVPVLGGNGTKIAPAGNIFDQPPGQMR